MRQKLRDLIVDSLPASWDDRRQFTYGGISFAQFEVATILNKIEALGFDIVEKNEPMDGTILTFKGKHRPTWHYDTSMKIPSDADTFRSPCGAEFRRMFAEYKFIFPDELPDYFCVPCMTHMKSHEMRRR